MELDDLAVDPTDYEDGKKLPLGDDCYIRIRSFSSERARKVNERLRRPYATFTKELPQATLDRINSDLIAQGLVTEFVGFTDGGKALEFDLSLADDQKRFAATILAPKYRALRDKIIGFSLDAANFQAAQDEGLAKNSATSPAGGSAGRSASKASS